MIDFIKNLDEIEKVRIKITFLLILVSGIIVFILSSSIYFLYENQKYVEIEDKLKTTLFEILPKLNEGISKIISINIEKNMFLCVYDMSSQEKLCINNFNERKYFFSKFNKENLKVSNGTSINQNLYILTYYYKSVKDFYIVMGQDITKVNEDLRKLKKSIFLSSITVIFLSGFLAFSVSGRLLRPLKQQKENLEHTLNIVAHDLKTPLSVINTNLYLMKVKNFQNVENHMYQIEKNLEYIKSIISNIDALKSISKEDLEDIKVSEILENILNKFQTSIKEKNIKVEFNKNEDALLKANKTDIEVCFTNLIDNAVKYNIKDGVIKIDISKDSIVIANTGKEIKNLKKIFEKFYREDKAGTTKGLGLGLSIVKKICQKYSFKIKAERKDDMNIFTIYFR